VPITQTLTVLNVVPTVYTWGSIQLMEICTLAEFSSIPIL